MTETKRRCSWLMLGQEVTCNRLAKNEGYCALHTNQKVKSFPCLTCGKGTRSKYRTCFKKGCGHEKIRHKDKMVKINKERDDYTITKYFKNKLLAELLKKVETTY